MPRNESALSGRLLPAAPGKQKRQINRKPASMLSRTSAHSLDSKCDRGGLIEIKAPAIRWSKSDVGSSKRSPATRRIVSCRADEADDPDQ